MIISRFSRNTKSFVFFKNEIIKCEFKDFKKMIKSKTFVNSRSFRRDFENVKTKLKFQRFVIDSISFVIFAFFVTFISTSFVTVVTIFFVTIVFAFFVTLFFIFAFLDELIVNSIFEEMNRDVLIRFFTKLISSFVDFANAFITNSISI
jgi:hypothetical protein